MRDIFPEIQRGRRLKTADHIAGDVPYVSSSAMNNGVDDFIGNSKNVRKFKECLTIANSGSVGKTFFHDYEFIASDHVTMMKSQGMNQYVYMFIASMAQRLQEKYSFNREINDTRINREQVMLPVDSSGQPDWSFMENYMRERERLLASLYKVHESRVSESVSLEGVRWGEFCIGKLFDIMPGRCSNASNLEHDDNGVPYVGATNRNNGVLDIVKPVEELMMKGNCIAFVKQGEGSVGYAVYKHEDFIASTSIAAGYAPFINRYTGAFITTVADKVRGKYSFNYPRSDARLKKELIQLPIDSQGQPDYSFMEEFIRHHERRLIESYSAYRNFGHEQRGNAFCQQH